MSWMFNTDLLQSERQDNMINRSRHQPSTAVGTSSCTHTTVTLGVKKLPCGQLYYLWAWLFT